MSASDRRLDRRAILAQDDFGEPIFATPAVAEETLYLRTAGHLYATGELPARKRSE